MKTIISILLVASAFFGVNKNETLTKTTSSEAVQQDILVGMISKEDLQQAPYSAWFDPMYKSYKPNKEALEIIKNNINDYEIKAFMGTWCGDSRLEIPRFYRLLDESGYDLSKLEMQAVKHDKTLPDDLQKDYDVHHVPTIIFYKNGKEVNRFVEYPQESFEKDIAKIVSEKEYHNSYQ